MKRVQRILPSAIFLALFALGGCFDSSNNSVTRQSLQRITINYPTRSGASWPLFIAKRGGYYEMNGLDVTLVFAGHPAAIAMVISGEAQATNYALDLALQASAKDSSLVIVGSSLNTAPSLALIARRNGITTISDLKGKRIAVSQVGDVPYNYSIALLERYGLTSKDVEWIPVGTDVNGRAAALHADRADASLLSAPATFRMEEAGYRNLGNLSDYSEILVSIVYLLNREAVRSYPRLPEQIIAAHSQAIKRFYEDREFAIQAYLEYDNQRPDDVNRIYDLFAQSNAFERIPYVLADAVEAAVTLQPDRRISTQMRTTDFRRIIDHKAVDQLVRTGFFDRLFGHTVKDEEARKQILAFGK